MLIKYCMPVEDTYMYGFRKIKAQGQSQDHVTSAFMWYSLKKKRRKKNIYLQRVLLDLVYRYRCIHSKLYL